MNTSICLKKHFAPEYASANLWGHGIRFILPGRDPPRSRRQSCFRLVHLKAARPEAARSAQGSS